jgi:MFS transporter, putative metabolite:H+ symporter
MADRTDGDLLAFFDSARPNARYWATIVLLCIASGVEFFDFYIVGFLVAVIGPLWHLTYGQSAIMLLSAGLGAIAGSLIGGALADVFGRKSLIVFGGIVCAASAGAISLVPDGACCASGSARALAAPPRLSWRSPWSIRPPAIAR